MSETRRLAAIMAIDVVGYSRLMGEDEAGTARAVREHREAARRIVAGLGGRIVKTMGDGLLLEFPSVVAAVECAISIQKLMIERNADIPEPKRIVYRVGVNLGDVLIEGDDILGEGVNIAARLEAICEPSGVMISGAAHDHVRGRLDAEFVDLGEKTLKNIARPVRVYALAPSGGRAAAAPVRSGPPRLSIVVLPFVNIGGDPEQEYFVDGVTESLTTDHSRMSGAVVIGRNTAFTYKGKAVDLKKIGRELNVRYVLEGSVQRGGDRIRVNVQLIDAETGNHLWAERFEKPQADLFDMQDEIVSRVANALNAQLIAAEARRAERAPNPDSIDLYFQGMAWINRGSSPDHIEKARGYFERALALDPDNVDALVGWAITETHAVGTFTIDNPMAHLASAETTLARALALAPEHALAHLIMGRVLIYSKRAAQGIAECERALALDRNLANAHAIIGLAKIISARPQETQAHIDEALRLSPRDHRAYVWVFLAGNAKFLLGRGEEAVACLSRAIEINRNNPIAHFYLAAAFGSLGRLDQAKSAVRDGLAINPTFTVSRFRAGVASDDPAYLAQRELVYDGMRKAGVPED
jgi:TolB-like protein/Tfp pilus assembly protein PilF